MDSIFSRLRAPMVFMGALPPCPRKLNFHKYFSTDVLIFPLKCKKEIPKNEEKPPILRRNSDHCPTKKNLYLCRR